MRTTESDLTAARLRELLDYDPATGAFTWRSRPSRYRHIAVDGWTYQASRLAWLWMTGSWGRASGSRFVGRGLGHAADANARDAAIVCSIALQCGADIETIRRALSRDSRGHTTGPLGVALDLICGGTEIEAGGTPNNDGLDIPDYLKRDAKAGAA